MKSFNYEKIHLLLQKHEDKATLCHLTFPARSKQTSISKNTTLSVKLNALLDLTVIGEGEK